MQRKGCLSAILGVVLWGIPLPAVLGVAGLLASCESLTVTDFQNNKEGTIMPEYNPRSFAVQNLRKRDFWTDTITNRLIDVQTEYARLIGDGYVIVDAPASGEIDLSALADGKYLVVWKTNDPTGTFYITANTTKTGAHTAVVIMGVKVNSYNVITDCLLDLGTLRFNGNTEYSKLMIRNAKYVLTLNGAPAFINQTNFEFSDISIDNTINLKPLKINQCIIRYTVGASPYPVIIFEEYSGIAPEFNNNHILLDTGTNPDYYVYFADGSNLPVLIKNCFFQCVQSNQSRLILNSGGGGNIFIFQNCFMENLQLGFDGNNFYGSSIYMKNSSLYNYSIKNIILLPFPADYEIFDPLLTWPELDLTVITNAAAYTNLDAIFTPIRKTTRGVRGSITRKYYKVDFQEFHPIDDDLKHFDMDDCLIVRRTEEEANLLGKSIIDLRLYDGAAEYEYRKDTSFLIVAENVLDATEKTIFAWHSNRLYPTVFGDCWNGKEYEITFCFQIFETPDDAEVRNYDAWDDSEMVGSLTYQDKTSKVIVL